MGQEKLIFLKIFYEVAIEIVLNLACSRPSVSGDDRKAARDERRATSDERLSGVWLRKTSLTNLFLYQTPHDASPALLSDLPH